MPLFTFISDVPDPEFCYSSTGIYVCVYVCVCIADLVSGLDLGSCLMLLKSLMAYISCTLHRKHGTVAGLCGEPKGRSRLRDLEIIKGRVLVKNEIEGCNQFWVWALVFCLESFVDFYCSLSPVNSYKNRIFFQLPSNCFIMNSI